MIQLAQACSSATRNATTSILMEMKRSGPEPSGEPFNVPSQDESIVEYGRTWARILMFFLRSRPNEEQGIRYRLLPAQASAFSRLQQAGTIAARDAAVNSIKGL